MVDEMTTQKNEHRRATIVDVAKRAGVSVSTASKVLRNHSYGVSSSMRSRVQAAIEELEYRPLAAARGMRGKTYTIGVVAADIGNPFLAMLLGGVVEGLHSSAYELMIGPAADGPDAHNGVIDAMIDRQMDGLLLIAPKVSSTRLADVARAVPTVVLGRHGPGDDFDTVAGDDLAGADLVVDHLVRLGHRQICFVSHDEEPPVESQPHSVRLRGYRESMARHGLAASVDVLPGEWTEAGGRRAGRALMARDGLPTAVFAGADVVAYGIMHELWGEDQRVAGSVSLVGYDDTPMAALAPISLTTVDQQGRLMGLHGGRLLLERFDGRSVPEHLTLAPRLVVRSSSRPPGRDAPASALPERP
jgi:LacI family transcriptional regulator